MRGHSESARIAATGKAKTKPLSFLLVFMVFVFSFSMVSHAATIKFKAKVPRIRYLVGESSQIVFKNTKRITYKFRSSNKKVFAVSKTGIIKAKKAGSATLTITGTWKKGSKKKTWTRQVTLYAGKCRLSKKELTLRQSQSKSLQVTNLSVNGKNIKRRISWYTETPQICSVDGNGTVTGLTEGSGVVCAKVGSQVVLKCPVTVQINNLGSTPVLLLVNATRTYGSLNIADEIHKESGPGQVTYTVSNPSIGDMTGDLYNAYAYGTNTICAYCAGSKKTFVIEQASWAAHRGYSDMHPENTIDAFIGAALAGAGFIETDIRVTKDGELVCFHDASLAHMTNIDEEKMLAFGVKTPALANLTFQQLRTLEIDNGNCISTLIHKQVPTLEEFLQVCARYHIKAIIEIKSLGTAKQVANSAAKLMSLLQKYNMVNQAVLTSYANETRIAQLLVFQQTVGAALPVATCEDTTAAMNTFINRGIQNVYRSAATTPLGYQIMEDYSPRIGRQNTASTGESSYR